MDMDMDNRISNTYETLKNRSNVRSILDSEGFYFQRGLEALNNLENSNNQKEYEELLKYIRGNKDWYKKIYSDSKSTRYLNCCEDINKFIAYCDINAKGTSVDGSSFYGDEGKRCIAKANLTPPTWIKNVAQYLANKANNKTFEGVTEKVQRAIEYFKKPEVRFPIVSDAHRELIGKFFGVQIGYTNDGKIDADEFDENLKDKFNENLNALTKIPQGNKNKEKNLTCLYTSIIYALKSEWEIFDTEFYTTNKNVILTGAPGTGKTYLAKKIAAKIISPNQPINVDTCPQIGFVQFHPSFDYTDFVEGLRPIQNGNDVGFKLKDGIFKKFCIKAVENLKSNYDNIIKNIIKTDEPTGEEIIKAYKKAVEESDKYVFIIDEINRGEISKIFGELFFSIDPGYRGKEGKVRTQYANMVEKEGNDFDNLLEEKEYGHFFVPENVYIIGTMNDIDRSVESMDFAFRRRFAFKEVTAAESKENILFYSDLGLSEDNLGKLSNAMDAINEKLTEFGFSDCYHIGAAYFQKIKNYSKNNKCDWNALWNYHLQGTLYEYFRGEPDADTKLKEIKTAYESAFIANSTSRNKKK